MDASDSDGTINHLSKEHSSEQRDVEKETKAEKEGKGNESEFDSGTKEKEKEEGNEGELKRDLEKANELKSKGNELFKAGNVHEAIEMYTKALEYATLNPEEERAIHEELDKRDQEIRDIQEKRAKEQEEIRKRQEAQESDESSGGVQFRTHESPSTNVISEVTIVKVPEDSFRYARAIFLSNRAACFIQLERNEDAVEDCTEAIEIAPNYLKAYVRRAKAFRMMEELEDAISDLDMAIRIAPTVQSIRRERDELAKMLREKQEKMKDEMLGKLKDLGNTVLGKFGMSLDNFKMEKDPNTGSYSVNYKG